MIDLNSCKLNTNSRMQLPVKLKNLFKIKLETCFWVSLVIFSLGFIVPSASYAQNIVKLQAVKDQAAIYVKPDFDEKIIYLLPKEKHVIGTRSTVEGLQGLGLFHKVKLNSKTYGYVLDTEVKVIGSVDSKKKNLKNSSNKKNVSLMDSAKSSDVDSTSKLEVSDVALKKFEQSGKGLKAAQTRKKAQASKNQESSKKKSNAKSNENSETKLPSLYEKRFEMEKIVADRRKERQRAMNPQSNSPLYFNRLVGVQAGLVNYTEKFQSSKKSSNEIVYGLKFTGPNLIFNNLLMDISVLFHFGAPSFFEDFTSDAGGFFILTDITFPFLLSRTPSQYIYGGLGPMLNATFFDFVYAGQEESAKKLRLGGVGTMGFAYQLGESFGLKIEGKYYFESTSYWGVLAGLQKRF